MASAYTTRLQLNQWAAGDKFLREEFNRDNQRVEAACAELYDGNRELEHRLTAEAADIRRQLDPASYHIYQLLLQNYYDGKYTGYRKALVFDGFQDAALVAEVTPGAYLDTEQRQVRVLTQGAQNINTGFVQEAGWGGSADSDANRCAWIGYSGGGYTGDTVLRPSGYGVLRSVALRLSARYSDTPITVSAALLDGTRQLAVSQTLTVSGSSFRDYTFSFSGGVALDGLRSYTLRITNVSQGHYLKAMYDVNDGEIGYSAVFSPTNHTTGAIQTPALQVGSGYTRVLAWARYSGGLGVTLTAGSAAQALAAVSSRPAQTLDGTACTETAYALEDAPASSGGNVTLSFSISAAGGSGVLYDYGVAFI